MLSTPGATWDAFVAAPAPPGPARRRRVSIRRALEGLALGAGVGPDPRHRRRPLPAWARSSSTAPCRCCGRCRYPRSLRCSSSGSASARTPKIALIAGRDHLPHVPQHLRRRPRRRSPSSSRPVASSGLAGARWSRRVIIPTAPAVDPGGPPLLRWGSRCWPWSSPSRSTPARASATSSERQAQPAPNGSDPRRHRHLCLPRASRSTSSSACSSGCCCPGTDGGRAMTDVAFEPRSIRPRPSTWPDGQGCRPAWGDEVVRRAEGARRLRPRHRPRRVRGPARAVRHREDDRCYGCWPAWKRSIREPSGCRGLGRSCSRSPDSSPRSGCGATWCWGVPAARRGWRARCRRWPRSASRATPRHGRGRSREARPSGWRSPEPWYGPRAAPAR